MEFDVLEFVLDRPTRAARKGATTETTAALATRQHGFGGVYHCLRIIGQHPLGVKFAGEFSDSELSQNQCIRIRSITSKL